MKLPWIIHRLQIWDPSSGKMRQRFFFRNQIIIGGDPKSDLKLKDLEGLAAKVDFDLAEMDLLQEGRVVKIVAQEFFTVGPYALLWTPLSSAGVKAWQLTLAGAMALVMVTLIFAWRFGSAPVCRDVEFRLSRQQWSGHGLKGDDQKLLEQVRRSLDSSREALRDRNWVRLKVLLREADRNLDEQTQRQSCQTDRAFRDLEFKMWRSMFREALQRGDHLEAHQQLDEILRSGWKKGTKSLKREMLNSARELYLEGYRREDEAPEEGAELMDRSTEICVKLGFESCFEGIVELKKKAQSGEAASNETN